MKPYRPWRALKRNHTTTCPSSFVVLDTETLPEPDKKEPGVSWHRLRLGVAIAWRVEAGKVRSREVCRFTSVREFWSFLTSRLSHRRPVWLFAHSLGFDWTIVRGWERLGRHNFTIRSACLDCPPMVLRLKSPAGNLVAVDTLNWFRCSLADLAPDLGMVKMAMPKFTDPDALWWPYCENDALILERAVNTLTEVVCGHDLGVFAPTAAAQALNCYRHKFLKLPIILHTKDRIKRLEREAYTGGQTECYFVGRISTYAQDFLDGWKRYRTDPPPPDPGAVHHVDAQSLYPAMMERYEFPLRLKDHGTRCTVAKLAELLERYAVIARVVILTDAETYPLRDRGDLLQAVGRFTTTLAGPELARAVAGGHVALVKEIAVYDRGPLFGPYVRYFWHLRTYYQRQGRPELARLVKVFLNSLPGKFGQRAFKWEDQPKEACLNEWGSWPGRHPATGEHTWFRGIGEHCQVRGTAEESDRSFCAISAYVNSYAREHMRRVKAVAGVEHVYYQDTDGLFVDQAGFDALTAAGELAEGELGKLRLIGSHAAVEIRGVRNYTAGGATVISGRKMSAEPVAELTYLQSEFEGIDQIVNRTPNGTLRVEEVKKDFHTRYKGRVVTPSGWTVPHVIYQEETDDERRLWELTEGQGPAFHWSPEVVAGASSGPAVPS